MSKFVKSISLLVVAVSAFASLALFSGNAFASADAPSLAFSPRCVNPNAQVGMFEVFNNEPTVVTLNYADEVGSGSKDLVSGDNFVYVPYSETMADLTVTFTWGLSSDHKTEVQIHDICSADQLAGQGSVPIEGACDNGTAADLNVIWNNTSQIAITTKSGLPLCNTLDMYYSTYLMPTNYNGAGFSFDNTTSYPQSRIIGHHFTLLGGTYGTWLENVPAPDACQNVAADLYFGPEVTNIGGDAIGYKADGNPVTGGYGHGDQSVANVIFPRDSAVCTGGLGGGSGSTGTTTATTTAATPGRGAGVTTALPTVLPDTGDASMNVFSALTTMIFGGVSLFAVALRTIRP